MTRELKTDWSAQNMLTDGAHCIVQLRNLRESAKKREPANLVVSERINYNIHFFSILDVCQLLVALETTGSPGCTEQKEEMRAKISVYLERVN
jgi:hypothetical protein